MQSGWDVEFKQAAMGIAKGAMEKVSKCHEMDQIPRDGPNPTRWTPRHVRAPTHHIEHGHGQYDGRGDDRQGDPRPGPVGNDAR